MKKTISWKRTTALATCALMFAAAAAGGLASLDFGQAAAASTSTVDVSKGLQEFDGWGLSLSWWASEIGDWTRMGSSGKTKREEVSEALFGKSGLDLNIARYNIGGGDDPTHDHMSDDRNTPGWKNASKQELTDGAGNTYEATVVDDHYVFEDGEGNILPWQETSDWKQLWVLDWIQNNPDRAEDYITEFYTNSPPYWMTVSGCSSGGEGGSANLVNDDEHNRAYIDYFLDVYEYLVSQGFRLEHLQPMNEPHGGWAKSGDQEGWHIDTAQKLELYSILAEEMEARNLEALAQSHGFHVGYNVGDECETDTAVNEYNGMARLTARNGMTGQEVLSGADRLTYHIYGYQESNAKEMYRKAKANGQDVYMSEICYTNSDDNGEANYDPDSLTTGFDYTQSIVNAIHNGVDAYIFWQGMEDMVGQMKGKTNYGLIQGVYYTQEEAEAQGIDLAAMGLTYQDFVLAKTYYMSGQYTKYIRPGYRIVEASDNTTVAAVSPDGNTLVIVKQNKGNGDDFRFDINGFNVQSIEKIVTDKNSSWAHSRVSVNGNFVADHITDNSITTYIVRGKNTEGINTLVDDISFKSGNTLEQAAALLDGSDTEQFYTDMNRGGGEAKYWGDTLTNWKQGADNGDGKYVAFKFCGTGFSIIAPKKNDSGKYSVYIDTPATGDPTDTVEMYQADKEQGAVVYKINDLEYGWHTVYLIAGTDDAGHKWVNLDGVRLYTTPDDTSVADKTISITSATGAGDRIKYTYSAVGLDETYTVYAEYANTSSEEWTATAGAAYDEAVTEGVINGVNYSNVRLRLCAKKGSEIIYSTEYAVKMAKLPEAAEGVLYFADCGTSNPASIATGAARGSLQSVSDQAYGEDLLSGKKWGYTNTLQNAGETGYFGTDEAMSSVMALEKTNEQAIEYKFEVPAGTYRVTLGFFGGNSSGWGTRVEKATVNGQEEAATVSALSYCALYKTVTLAEDGEIAVTVEKNDAEQGNPVLSLIIIADEEAKLPLYADGTSTLNRYSTSTGKKLDRDGDIATLLAADTYNLYLSDNTTASYQVGADKVSYTMNAGSLNVGTTAKVYLTHEDYPGIVLQENYAWKQEGSSPLYYNVDVGYTGNNPPDDVAGNIGTKQTTTKDRKWSEGQDGDRAQWGCTTSIDVMQNTFWADSSNPAESFREIDGYNDYRFSGFDPNEPLKVEVGGSMGSWGGTRTFDVSANSASLGTVTAEGVGHAPLIASTTANSSGVLLLTITQGTGGKAPLAYIKVWGGADGLPEENTITADMTALTSDSKVTLGGLDTEGYVYVVDDGGMLLKHFKPSAATEVLDLGELTIGRDVTELKFMQVAAGKELSAVLEISFEAAPAVPDIEVLVGEDYVQDGTASEVRFVPQTEFPVTSLTLTTPDHVNYNLMEGFFFRATVNGQYTVTLVSGGYTIQKNFEVANIDALDLNASYSTEAWTDGDVTVTLAPAAKSGEAVSVAIDGVPATANGEGKYTFTATENGEHTVTVKTPAGFLYERTVTVSNIDKAAPELDLTVGFSANGLTVGYAASAVSGGTLYLSFNGETREITENDAFSLNEEGKYEVYFVNGLNVSTERAVYYVTYGAEKANLATVTVGEDGVVNVAPKARAEMKTALYRAGDETPLEDLKAEKAGKYYLDIASGAERELVVLYVSSAAAGGGAGDSASIGGTGGNDLSGLMYAGIAIGCAAVVAAGIACTLIIIKRRKNG